MAAELSKTQDVDILPIGIVGAAGDSGEDIFGFRPPDGYLHDWALFSPGAWC